MAHPGGRPSIYTPELADLICDRIATHPVGYPTLQKMYDDLPAPITVREWRRKYSEFSAKYLDAKSLQAQILVEEIDEMLPSDIKTYFDDKGNERVDAPSASMMIAKINNRKWTAARLAPKTYGDHKQVEELQSQNESIKRELEDLRKRLAEQHEKDY